jgi:hypothetical protein
MDVWTGSAYDGEMLSPSNKRMPITGVPFAFKANEANTLKAISGGNSTTINIGTPTGTNTITLPGNASGTVCLTSGNCAGVGGTGDILQNGNSFPSTDVTIGSNNNQAQ